MPKQRQPNSVYPRWIKESGGLRKNPTWGSWKKMIERCYYPKHHAYSRYGGRGIKVCLRWLVRFENFLKDMGPRPEGMTLDRRDNDRGYSRSNCRWATNGVQLSNRRATEKMPRNRYLGVSYDPKTGTRLRPWVGYLQVNRKKYRVYGRTEQEAAQKLMEIKKRIQANQTVWKTVSPRTK